MYRLNQMEEHDAYRAEMLRKAARRRVVQDALNGRRGRIVFYAPVMVSLGKKMIRWGHALQRRYTSVPEFTLALPEHTN